MPARGEWGGFRPHGPRPCPGSADRWAVGDCKGRVRLRCGLKSVGELDRRMHAVGGGPVQSCAPPGCQGLAWGRGGRCGLPSDRRPPGELRRVVQCARAGCTCRVHVPPAEVGGGGGGTGPPARCLLGRQDGGPRGCRGAAGRARADGPPGAEWHLQPRKTTFRARAWAGTSMKRGRRVCR
ncbi:hypothetical protein VULLAG_LOCUS16256 [Vulpes lagopus]